jgi:hypothetical protein
MITQTITTSFKYDCYTAQQNLLTDTLKMALYTAAADLNADTAAYTSVNEVSSANYTAGGQVLTGVTVSTSGTTVYVSFNNPSWSNVSFTCRGALIYNSSKSNKSIAVLNFGSDKVATPATPFTVILPANTATSALIRS